MGLTESEGEWKLKSSYSTLIYDKWWKIIKFVLVFEEYDIYDVDVLPSSKLVSNYSLHRHPFGQAPSNLIWAMG